MKELLLIKDTLANKISYYHLMLLLLSLPFDRFYSHIILISFAIHTIIQYKKNAVKPIFTLRTLALQSVFFVTAISTIYTSNRTHAFVEWGLDIPILILPLLLCINPIDLRKYKSNLLLIFALGCTATIVYLYFDAFITIRYYKLSFKAILSPAFTNHNFSKPLNIHATFFSLQLVIGLIHLLSQLINKNTIRISKSIYRLCVIILIAGIIQLSSKSIFLALFLIINLALPFIALQGKARSRYFLIVSTISVLAFIGIVNTPYFKNRYLTEFRKDLSATNTEESLEPRMERWIIATELIQQSPLIGYGAGTEIGLLEQKYFDKKYYYSFISHLNAHNQYLSFLIKSGIWGLLIYLLTLFYGFKKAMQKSDIVFFSFMLIVSIVSFSENLLDVDKGVMFYSIFFSFFAFSSYQNAIENYPEKTINIS